MKKSKVLAALLGAALLLDSTGLVYADVATTYHFGTTTTTGGDIANDLTAPTPSISTLYTMGFNQTTGNPEIWRLNSGLFLSGNQLDVILPITNVVGLNDYINDFNAVKFPFLYTGLAAATSSVSSLMSSTNNYIGTLTTSLNALSNTVSGIATPLNIAAFMGSNASTTPYIASSTQNGFMSAAMATKLASLGTTTPRSMATSTHSIVTGTGATGFQVSATRDAEVRYSTTIVTTSNIAGSQNGTVVLEIAPTNSATSTDWAEIGRCTNGTAYTLAVAIQGISTQACQITGYAPAGYYEKLRSINNAGTPTYTYNSGQEVLQ